MKSTTVLGLILLAICHISDAWIHNLKLLEDDRPRITLTRPFGFLKGGTLAVNVSMFSCNGTELSKADDHTFGFTLDRTTSPGLTSYMESNMACVFKREGKPDEKASISLRFDLQNKRVVVERGNNDLTNLTIVAVPRELYLYHHHLAHGVNTEVTQQVQDTSDKSQSDNPKAGNKDVKTGGQEDKGDVAHTETSLTADNPGQTAEKVTPSDTDGKGETAGDDDTDGDNTAGDDDTGGDGDVAADKKTEKSDKRGDDSGNRRRKREASNKSEKPAPETSSVKTKTDESSKTDVYLPMTQRKEGTVDVYQTYFLVHVKTEAEEGLYSLLFHNCLKKCVANLALQIIQDNNGNYLSAGEMPIPALFFLFSVVFFIQTIVWFSVLRRAEEGVYKVHYLMLVVVFFKCLSSLFHGVNMHMIQLSGIHVDAWAILWYIVYLMKGAVMFVTVLLIGAGWAFIKHVFSHREKKLFLIVLPLQILLNVAWVIVEESEEGYSSYNTWSTIFIAVDLICCFAILFPVIWSIRHLQEASRTDGKAAINLNKLKLFRHFYILVVAYIYSTRIIKYLLHITLPFRFGWMEDLFEEIFLLVFFTLTGYKFRPTSDNPYLQVPLDSDDEEEIEMDEVMTKSGATETVVRVNQGRTDKHSDTTTTTKQRESSHEYD